MAASRSKLHGRHGVVFFDKPPGLRSSKTGYKRPLNPILCRNLRQAVKKTLFRNPIWMYAPNMRKCFRGVPVVVMVAWNLASCDTAARSAAAPAPEAEQVVSAALKKLYMAASAAAPQSPAQQKVILEMAEKASNGKELLLVMRAAVGVFPAATGSQESERGEQGALHRDGQDDGAWNAGPTD